MTTNLVNRSIVGPGAVNNTGWSGAFTRLIEFKAPTASRVFPNIQGRPYELCEQHFGQFVIPPQGAFNPTLLAPTPSAGAGYWEVGLQGGAGVAGGTLQGTTKFVATVASIGECVIPVIHPYMQKGSCMLLLPNSENSPAANAAFLSAYYGAWNTIVGALPQTGAGVASVAGNSAANSGSICISQVDNGSFVVQMAAQIGWPCFGMKVDYLILNPPKSVFQDSGTSTWLGALDSTSGAANNPFIPGPSIYKS